MALAGAVLLCGASGALALGFRNPDQGARATGQGEAFVAQADDASAIWYNPAGLTQVEGTEVTSGGYLSFPNIRFTGLAGSDEMDKMAFLPHLYVASDLGSEKWRVGLGVNVPFGNAVEYSPTGPFQFLVTKSELTVINIEPAASYRLNEHLSVGVGLNIYYGMTEVNFDYTPFFPGSRFKFDGDGVAVSAMGGVLWKINSQHSVGVTYRGPFSIEFDGDAVVKNPPPPLVLPDPGPSPARATIDFPQSVAVGYAFRPTKRLKLEVDVEWTDWETLNTVQLKSPNPHVAGDPRATVPYNWESSFYYEFGAQYDLNDKWQVRAGYIFSENTVPDSTFSPVVPDSDRHVFSIGAGYASKRLDVDIVYQYSLSEDRTVSTSAVLPANGDWESDGHLLMMTGSIKF